jgi:hypothetical protein
MPEKPTRLADYGNMAEGKTLVVMADLEGEDVIIQSFTQARGEHGNFVTMKLTRADGEIATVRTASAYIVQALREAKAKNAFPVAATFTLHGKTWLVD